MEFYLWIWEVVFPESCSAMKHGNLAIYLFCSKRAYLHGCYLRVEKVPSKLLKGIVFLNQTRCFIILISSSSSSSSITFPVAVSMKEKPTGQIQSLKTYSWAEESNTAQEHFFCLFSPLYLHRRQIILLNKC